MSDGDQRRPPEGRKRRPAFAEAKSLRLRAGRLADALRENLGRRKRQQRARAAAGADAAPREASETEPDDAGTAGSDTGQGGDRGD